jgi:hypothetical protein
MQKRHNFFSKYVVKKCVTPEARRENAAKKRHDHSGAAKHALRKYECKVLAESLKN